MEAKRRLAESDEAWQARKHFALDEFNEWLDTSATSGVDKRVAALAS